MQQLLFLRDKHVKFLKKAQENRNSPEALKASYVKMAAIYWMTAALDLLGVLTPGTKEYAELRDDVLKFIESCRDPKTGAYGFDKHLEPHITSTLYAVLLCLVFHDYEAFDPDQIAQFVASLQQSDGSFWGSGDGEFDTRFSYCAVSILSLIRRPHVIDREAAARFILSCHNPDGGFGSLANSESHAAYAYLCINALALLGGLNSFPIDEAAEWLARRQIAGKCGGFNGRPQKAPDVCYSWWIYSALTVMERDHWISKEALVNFILSSQDQDLGGIADRPNDMPDIFHTFFGIAALSLLSTNLNLKRINPIYCVSEDAIARLQHYSSKLPKAKPLSLEEA